MGGLGDCKNALSTVTLQTPGRTAGFHRQPLVDSLTDRQIHIHIKFKTRANVITSSRQSKHTYALVYVVHRAIYITAYV